MTAGESALDLGAEAARLRHVGIGASIAAQGYRI